MENENKETLDMTPDMTMNTIKLLQRTLKNNTE
jgi:hypothetical protein